MLEARSDSWLDNIRNVTHELKNPIGAAKGFIELAEASGPLQDDQKHYLERALQSLAKTERLITTMLQAAWIDSSRPLKMGDTDFAGVVQHEVESLEPLAHQQKVQLHIEIAPNVGLMTADTERVGHIVGNLVANAIKYNKTDGEVWVKTSSDDQQVIVEVRDTGRGIEAADIEHIFERFYRAGGKGKKVEGNGLGLYIVKSLVDLHQGQIDVTSTPGEGSTFTVKLPRHPAANSAASR
jgi:two-component system, OmpR family, phosphate regulon sensor histidine kinase PhoR